MPSTSTAPPSGGTASTTYRPGSCTSRGRQITGRIIPGSGRMAILAIRCHTYRRMIARGPVAAGIRTGTQYLVMIYGKRYPGGRTMAGITSVSRQDMTSGDKMAVSTGTKYLGMIYRSGRGPGSGPMTGLAHISRGNMPRSPGVTAGANPQHLGMIDADYRRPYRSGMAGIAQR